MWKGRLRRRLTAALTHDVAGRCHGCGWVTSNRSHARLAEVWRSADVSSGSRGHPHALRCRPRPHNTTLDARTRCLPGAAGARAQSILQTSSVPATCRCLLTFARVRGRRLTKRPRRVFGHASAAAQRCSVCVCVHLSPLHCSYGGHSRGTQRWSRHRTRPSCAVRWSWQSSPGGRQTPTRWCGAAESGVSSGGSSLAAMDGHLTRACHAAPAAHRWAASS